jgi:hypothetical protein
MKGWIEVHEIDMKTGEAVRKRAFQVSQVCWVSSDKHRPGRGAIQANGSEAYVTYTIESYEQLRKLIEAAQ